MVTQQIVGGLRSSTALPVISRGESYRIVSHGGSLLATRVVNKDASFVGTRANTHYGRVFHSEHAAACCTMGVYGHPLT